MTVSIVYGTEHIDWVALCELIRMAPLGAREPEKLKRASENSFTVCSAFIDGKMVGFGRALSDGVYQSALYDVVVLPEYQNMGIGKALMAALLEQLPKQTRVILYAAPGKQAFYQKIGFRKLKTGMGLFPDMQKAVEKGLLE